MLIAESDSAAYYAMIVAVVTAVIALCNTVFQGIMTIIMARIKAGQDVAAMHAAEVKAALANSDEAAEEHLDDQDKKLNTIHLLVNSGLGVPLKALALALRRTANTTKSPADIQAANEAEEASRLHESKQASVDAKG